LCEPTRHLLYLEVVAATVTATVTVTATATVVVTVSPLEVLWLLLLPPASPLYLQHPLP
jgi:hypothetical protein